MPKFSARARAHMDRAAAAAEARDPQETAAELLAVYDAGDAGDRARLDAAVRAAFTRK